jgi:hypothetical protein
MLEHLTNCHGEWNALFALISSLPVIGVWARHKLSTRKNGEETCKTNLKLK